MTSRRLLYIAFWYPPSRASGVYRALATTRAFVDSGWEVTVVTTTAEFLEREIGSVDPSLVREIPTPAEVVRIPFSFDPDVSSIGWFRGNFPVVWDQLRAAADRVGGRVGTVFGRTRPRVSEGYASWVPDVVDETGRLDKTFDHILATGNPYSAFEAARILSQSTSTPFSVDFRDPWTIDVFTGGRAKVSPATEAAERRIVEQATACIHVNEPIAAAYREKYPEQAAKQHVILNGFDEDSVSAAPKAYQGGAMRIGMLGTVNDRWPLDPIFAAWASLREELPNGSSLVLGGHLGYFAKSAEPLARLLPDPSEGFEFLGPIAKSDVADFYAGLDVIVVPVPDSTMVTSGKIYEAMGVGTPLVCVQGRGGDARRVASSHPFAFLSDPEHRSVAAAIREAVEARRSITEAEIASTRESMRRFERSATIRGMVHLLESALTTP